MKELEQFNKDFESWLLSRGFKPYGHEFHMKYKKSEISYRPTAIDKFTNRLILWLQYNLDPLNVKEIHYRLVNNLTLVIEKVEFLSSPSINSYKLLFLNEVSSPSTIKEIILMD